MRIDFDLRDFYFDRPEIERAIRRLGLDPNAYRRYALYLRKVAIRSIRKTTARPGSKAWRKASLPGRPPRSRDPQQRLRKILVAWDPRLGAMIVGPVFFKRTGGTTVPAIHEKAKTVIKTTNVYKVKSKKAVSKAQREAYKRLLAQGRIPYPQPIGTATFAVSYPKRAFMWPAAEKTMHRFPEMWANSVKLGG